MLRLESALFRGEGRFEGHDKRREIVAHGVPKGGEINEIIAVGQVIPHPNDRFPGNTRKRSTFGRRDASRRFSHYLHQFPDRILMKFMLKKLIF